MTGGQGARSNIVATAAKSLMQKTESGAAVQFVKPIVIGLSVTEGQDIVSFESEYNVKYYHVRANVFVEEQPRPQ